MKKVPKPSVNSGSSLMKFYISYCKYTYMFYRVLTRFPLHLREQRVPCVSIFVGPPLEGRLPYVRYNREPNIGAKTIKKTSVYLCENKAKRTSGSRTSNSNYFVSKSVQNTFL